MKIYGIFSYKNWFLKQSFEIKNTVLVPAKGQKISKAIDGVLKSFKKINKTH